MKSTNRPLLVGAILCGDGADDCRDRCGSRGRGTSEHRFHVPGRDRRGVGNLLSRPRAPPSRLVAVPVGVVVLVVAAVRPASTARMASMARTEHVGPRGTTGATGPAGPQGAPGVAAFYTRTLVSNASTTPGGQVNSRPTCDVGDVATGGGFRLANTGQTILYSQPLTGSTRSWEIQGFTAKTGETMTGYVVCADLG